MPISADVMLGDGVALPQPDLVNLYGCRIGDGSRIGAFVEIQKNAAIGARCKVSSHTFICEGVTIEDQVFVGHGVVFINDSYPRATTASGDLQTADDWKVEYTVVKKGATLGANCTIVCGITIREYAFIGAGAVVNRDVQAYALMAGVPAKQIGWMSEHGEQIPLPLEGSGEHQCPHSAQSYRLEGRTLTRA